jgi:NADH-quinone oxidoreductase subunit H
VYGIMLAGWSSGSKYPLLGSVRASAQMVSYEAALGLSVATIFLLAGTMSTNGIVSGQSSLRNWNIVATGVVPFVIFLVAATAELNRPPFDLVEAEQELVGGFNTEYSSIRFALFFLAEFMNTMTMSAIIVTLFLGGPQPVTVGHTTINVHLGPFTGTFWFLLKVLVFLYIYIWFRATLPRLRYDQLMDLGWKLLIPVALAWFMALAGLKVAQNAGWSGGAQVLGMVVGAAIILIGFSLLRLASRASTRNRAEEGAMF